MSSAQLKQLAIHAILKLLNSTWSMIVVFVGLIWLWLRLDATQVKRVQELEPILNSKVGFFFIVLVIISYIISIFGSLKDEIRTIFTLPMQMMTQDLKTLLRENREVQKVLKQLCKTRKNTTTQHPGDAFE